MDKRTLPFINKYERAQIIAQRARDIAEGAPITAIGFDPNSNAIDIAKLEYTQKRLPYKIYREFYNKSGETWELKNFKN